MSVSYYHGLLVDSKRIRAFEQAINHVVGPESDVLEIGTGLGTYALFAARAGARCVWAMDGSPILHVAETIAKVNGHQDRIFCLRGWAPEVDLPAPVNVLIFEDFASRLFDTRMYRLVRDSIAKYLVPGGQMIPGGARVFVAPVSSPEVRKTLFPLDGLEGEYDIDWSPSLAYMQNAPTQVWLPEPALAAGEQLLYDVRFPELPAPSDMSGSFMWNLPPGTGVHGIALWFELDLAGGSVISNRPSPDTGPWGQTVFPLDPPVVVGDSGLLNAEISVDTTDDGAPGWFGWKAASDGATSRGHEFAAAPAALDDLMGSERPSEPTNEGSEGSE